MKAHVPSETAVTAWARLVRAFTQLHSNIEGALKAAGLPPLAWYDVLLELHRERDSGLRQFEIGAKVLLPKHNLSRLLDRLESHKLVHRQACAEDGRGNVVLITQEGSELLKRMWSVYGDELHASMESRLEPAEVALLGETLGKLIK